MKIYLLLLDQARFFFYSDESEASLDNAVDDDQEARPRSGFFGWLHTRYDRFRAAWQHADSGALLWMRRSWDWLHSWARPDETMLSRLWSARRIELHHPASRTDTDVRVVWSDYLSQQWRRHLLWMIVNGMIAPFSLLLFVLPGPNLIGYWFAYRAIHHALVVWGISRVQSNKIPTELYPTAGLDLPIEPRDHGKSGHTALTGSAARLDDHVRWHTRSRATKVGTTPKLATTQIERNPAHSQPEQSRDG